MEKHIPNPDTYRPLLGKDANAALFQLAAARNEKSLSPLGVNEYLRKMIVHWWNQEFPDQPCPVKTKPYIEDVDFEIVQSENIVQSA